MQRQEFLTRPLIYYRSYSRFIDGIRENWEDTCDRTLSGLKAIGNLTDNQAALIDRLQREYKTITSGRFLWVGGTKWLEDPDNVYGGYNCSSTIIDSIHAIALQMALSMTGCGVGGMIEDKFISEIPKVTTKIEVSVTPMSVNWIRGRKLENTKVEVAGENAFLITVGDSRQGWVDAYEQFMTFAVSGIKGTVKVEVDLSYIRPKGEAINGFGGVANAAKLPQLWERLADILNGAIGRSLNAEEVCLLIDEGSVVVVAGNIRRSAGIKQFDASGKLLKTDLWSQDGEGNWVIDPKKDALRMSNHTRVYHKKPDLDECIDAVRSQYFSGEGAIQWAGEAVARANADILDDVKRSKKTFLELYDKDIAQAKAYLESDMILDPELTAKTQEDCDQEVSHRMLRYGLNPCGEILLKDNFCVAGNTLLITREGLGSIESFVGREVEIWNGERWSKVTPFKTGGNQKMLRVHFGDGSYLDTTEYHRFLVKNRFQLDYSIVQAKDLSGKSKYQLHTKPFRIEYNDGANIDLQKAYTLGVMVGDGTVGIRKDGSFMRNQLVLHGAKQHLPVIGTKSDPKQYEGYKDTCVEVSGLNHLLDHVMVLSLKNNVDGFDIIASWNKDAILNFIAGLADTDGYNTSSGGIRIYVSQYERAKRLQLLLTKCGVRSSICEIYKAGEITNYGRRKHDLYGVQITECGDIPCYRLDVSRSHKPKKKGKHQVITSVEELPELQDSYCFTEKEFNNGVFGNTLTKNCNLSEVHLNMIDPNDHDEQDEAFYAAGVSASVLLHQSFPEERYQYSRKVDPIVGVSFTGLFDFFVNLLGVNWLKWWEAGRPEQWGDVVEGIYDFDANYTHLSEYYKDIEAAYLTDWRESATRGVYDYCDRNNLRRPNRCTTCQPSGSKSLLTNASPGWHPPKASRYIRRMTFARDHSIASAAIAYGYSVIPSQSDKDENGQLLNDPFDPRCTEWLVEVPIETSWANLEGAADVDISKFSALAQFDFYMQVQKHYTTHNTSATIELRESEIELVGDRVYQAIRDDEGYVSCAFLARFDDLQTFPRLPFEPIDKETYDRLVEGVIERRTIESFAEALQLIDGTQTDSAKKQEMSEAGPAGCDSDKCLFPNAVVSD